MKKNSHFATPLQPIEVILLYHLTSLTTPLIFQNCIFSQIFYPNYKYFSWICQQSYLWHFATLLSWSRCIAGSPPDHCRWSLPPRCNQLFVFYICICISICIRIRIWICICAAYLFHVLSIQYLIFVSADPPLTTAGGNSHPLATNYLYFIFASALLFVIAFEFVFVSDICIT